MYIIHNYFQGHSIQTKLVTSKSSPFKIFVESIKKHSIQIKLVTNKSSTTKFSSVSCVWLLATPKTEACRTSLSIANSQIYSDSCPLSQWCHSTVSSSVIPFSSCLQFFQASGSFQMSWYFASGGQSTGVSTWTSVLPMNIQDWFPLGWTIWISLQSKGLSRAFSNTTVQKHQSFGAQLSLNSNAHIHTWVLEIP